MSKAMLREGLICGALGWSPLVVGLYSEPWTQGALDRSIMWVAQRQVEVMDGEVCLTHSHLEFL